jgi:hypothetical protein
MLRDFDLRRFVHLGLAVDGSVCSKCVVLVKAPRLLNASRVGLSVEGAIYIGRPSPYGNPYVVGVHGLRGECIGMFVTWIRKPEQSWLVEIAKRELRGKDLICWCAPRPCHGRVWLGIVNE